MKILLLKPKWFVHGGVYRYLEYVKFTPLHLGILAALSNGHEVKVVDGDWNTIPLDEKFDLVGITTTTFTSEQVYDLAHKFRDSGAKVVLGGVHPSLMPDECLQHCDSVVIGESEYVWKEVLNDVENNRLQKTYHSDRIVDMSDVPFPRRDLLNEQSWFACVQATRGCPNSCRYCYLPNVPWHKFRQRNIDSIYKELTGIKQKIIFFVDDNLFADHEYAMNLSDRIKPLKKIWSIQAPTNITKNESMIAKMAESGCFNVQIGFQTVNPESLKWASIKQNRVEEYKRVVDLLHKYKILVTAFIIFGFDTDDKNVFDATIEMVKMLELDDANLYILTPYPGTDLYEQFKQEGRLLENKDRLHYGWAHAVFKPKLMSAEELEQGVQYANNELYKYFKKKFPKALWERKDWLIRHPGLVRAMLRGGLGKIVTGRRLK